MPDPLEDYRRKRDFARTSEPAGAAGGDTSSDAARFVIQRHAARALHFDLRLERDGRLWSWAVPKGLPLRHGMKRLAVRTEDHPLEYLTYAGEIPEGAYGAGRMTIWDRGTIDVILWDDREIKVILHGGIVDGEYHLVQTRGRDGRDEWLVFLADRKAPDAAALERRFHEMRPMLATTRDDAFDDADWSFEVKWDGYRALACVTGDGTELRSRTGRDLVPRFPRLADLRGAVDAQEVVLDGEVVVLDDQGRAVFQDLQTGRGSVTYVVFDLLYVDGTWIEDRPYHERRDALRAVLGPASGPVLLSDDVVGDGRALFAAVGAQGAEGIVGKRRSSSYRAGTRTPNWVKIKYRQETEALICGFTPGEGNRRKTFGALVIGEPVDDAIVPLGHVGSGFRDGSARALRRTLDGMVVPESPLTGGGAPVAGTVWVAPTLRCRVRYSERTEDGLLRHPVFLGMVEHEPAAPTHVIPADRDEVRLRDDGREVRLTNLGKTFWTSPRITKGDVVDHYARLAEVLLPHIAGRPMVMKRYPNGWDQSFFFQHRVPDGAPSWLRTVMLQTSGGPVRAPVIDDVLGLLWMVNLGCIDLNPLHSHAETPELADHVLFDLDPADGVTFDAITDLALRIRDRLEDLGLRSWCKTSGSRGMHLLVPVEPTPHEAVRLFASVVARQIVAANPDRATIETAIARRGRRIYIDVNQNGEGKTIASVYSLRPVAAATVSTPVTWDEVADGIDPTRFTSAAAAERVQQMGDLFGDLRATPQNLGAAVERLDA